MKKPEKPTAFNEGIGGNSPTSPNAFVRQAQLRVVEATAKQARIVNLSGSRREYVDPYLFESGFYMEPLEYLELMQDVETRIQLRSEAEKPKRLTKPRSR